MNSCFISGPQIIYRVVIGLKYDKTSSKTNLFGEDFLLFNIDLKIGK
jgi:hypothetical protein